MKQEMMTVVFCWMSVRSECRWHSSCNGRKIKMVIPQTHSSYDDHDQLAQFEQPKNKLFSGGLQRQQAF